MVEMKTGKIRRVTSRIFAVILLILQGAVLDFYLAREKERSWIAWIVTDVFVLAAWVYALAFSYRKKRNSETESYLSDELTIAYVAWIAYTLHLVPQIAVIMKLIGHKLDEETMTFGPNVLLMNFCLTPILFLFLVLALHDTQPSSIRKFYLEKLVATVTIDLFDSVEMLEYLFSKHNLTPVIEHCILSFSCINLFLPTLALYELKHNKFHPSGEVSSISFKFLYICVFLLFVDLPFLVLRLILWHSFDLDVGVLLAKNVLGIILGLVDIAEYLADQRPKKCDHCGKTFDKTSFKSHLQLCVINDEEIEFVDRLKTTEIDKPARTMGSQTLTTAESICEVHRSTIQENKWQREEEDTVFDSTL